MPVNPWRDSEAHEGSVPKGTGPFVYPVKTAVETEAVSPVESDGQRGVGYFR
jgi:hypothetical protein